MDQHKPVLKRPKKSKENKQIKKSIRKVVDPLLNYLNHFKWIALWTLLLTGLVLFTYVGYLDYTVSRKFESRGWALPAHVYASPVELYNGVDMTPQQFERLLLQLRYRPDTQLLTEATFYRSNNQFTVKTRRFRFWDTMQGSQTIEVHFKKNKISQIVDLSHSGSVSRAIVRLDPVQIGEFYPSRKEDRILVYLDEVPEQLLQGLLSVEDRDYYQHYGVSFKGILRAAWINFRAGKVVQGGSTITQQLVKNLYLDPERTLWRKINEAFMALIIDARYSKEAILETYLNEIYLGQDGSHAVHGFGLASQYYFNRSVSELQLKHSALLVALVKGPSMYNPHKYPQRILARRNQVLTLMQQQGYINAQQAERAKQQDLGVVVQSKHHLTGRYPAFLQLVRRQLSQQYRDEDLTSEGLQVFTTLDLSIQKHLQETVDKTLTKLEKRKKVTQLEVAAVVTRREGGEVVALVGGRNPGYAGFNRALDAVRPIGSLIKPVVYLTALSHPQRYTLTTRIHDTKIRLRDRAANEWIPRNYDRKEHGWVPLHRALAQSYNLATVQVGLDLGLDQVIKTLRQLGVRRPLNLYPSLLLGACALTPLEVSTIYQTLAGDGFTTPARAITAVISREGERLQKYALSVRQAVDPGATFLTNTALQEVMRSGTGRAAYSIVPAHLNVAGKTGTTNEMRDSWFAGFTGDYLGVVWVGRDDNQPAHLTGSQGAMRVWAHLMKQVGRVPVDLVPTDDIRMAWVDEKTGLAGDESCPNMVEYPYIAGSEPKQTAPCVQNDGFDRLNDDNNNLWDWF